MSRGGSVNDGGVLSLSQIMNAQSPINLDADEQQYLELTREYRNFDEMRFYAHRVKYQ
jgi:hypothetical protein